MATSGESLGTIHRQYNKRLKEAIADHPTLDTEFKPSDNDIENFIKIDIANHKKDVGYILSVLKCEDSLYVSRALKRSAWLVTEPQHAHIVNPHHLHRHLFPHMTTKNYIKLIKHIKLTLKDETRAEEFYLSEKDPKVAVTWLPLCSVSFIENNIERHLGPPTGEEKLGDLKVRTFKRLCEKSDTIFEIVMKKSCAHKKKRYLSAVIFMLHTNVDMFLDVFELKNENIHFSDKATNLIMKHSPKRVIDNFEKYIECIHVPTFAKHLKGNDVKIFLYEQAKKDLQKKDMRRMRKLYDVHFKYFIKRLPKDEQFKFVKDVFMDKVFAKVPAEELLPDTEAYGMKKLNDAYRDGVYCDPCSWYEYATFEIANEAYKKEWAEKPLTEQYDMIYVLAKCANHNLQHTQTVLQHCMAENTKKHPSAYYLKLNFIDKLLWITSINYYDEVTWNMLNSIFIDLKIYEEHCADAQQCVQFIVVYNTLHGIPIPEIIQEKFEYRTLKPYQPTMNQEQKDKIFSYLYQYLLPQLKETIANEEEFAKSVKTLEKVLKLFIDWEKELADYPFVINTINELVTLKKEHSWKTDLSSLYNMNKKWKRHLFSASLSMCPNEKTCLNVLKHEPRLLARHSAELRALRGSNIALGQLLAKLRTYWPLTIAKEWTDEYIKILNDGAANKALLRGLCSLLLPEPLMNTIKENAPEEPRIDWDKADERKISLGRFIASNMHVARPQPAPEAILLYAKGDYLKFALPSLLAMFYNLNPTLFRVYIPKVLDAPVSLQKHGIRFLYCRCNGEEVKEIFLDIWKASKNPSIRAVIFYFTHTLLCKEKDDTKVTELWKLIETFIDSLTFEEDKKIYELLFKVENVPLIVRGNYLIKSYNFLLKFLPNVKSVHVNYETRIRCLGEYSRNIMEVVSPDFVSELINRFIDEKYIKERCSSSHGMIRVLSAYLLCAKDELTQMQRYENVLVPIMQNSLHTLNEYSGPSKLIRTNFLAVLECLTSDLKMYVVKNNWIVPTKMFAAIQSELQNSLSIQQNYLLVTEWKLLIELTKLVEGAYSTDNDWSDICNKISLEFGKKCVYYLKEDIKVHFPCIYILFSKALKNILNILIDKNAQKVFFAQFLSDVDFKEGYLVTIQILADAINCNRNEYKDITRLLTNHASVEIRFHCSNRIPEKEKTYY